MNLYYPNKKYKFRLEFFDILTNLRYNVWLGIKKGKGMMIEILVNAKSKNSLHLCKGIKKIFDSENIEFVVHKTTKEINAQMLMSKVKSKELIVIGGDGTINEVINNYHGENILYIPSGSGNDLGRSLNILGNNIDKIIQRLKNNQLRQYDVGTANDRKFCSVFDIGFNADIIKRVEKSKIKKHVKKYIYTICGVRSIFNIKKYKAKIIVDDFAIETNKLYALNVMIQPYAGGGIRFSPTATGQEGLLNIMIMHDISIINFIYNYLCLLCNKQDRMKNVKLYKAKNIKVKTNQQYYEVDGEIIENTDGFVQLSCIKEYYKIK